MQINLTKVLADALKLKPDLPDEEIDPIFTWTAHWVNTWANRKTKDLLVLVNNKTHFGVAIYQFKRKDLKSISEKVWTAIENTLLAAGYNPEIVDEYMRQAGEIHFAKNNNRRASAWVTKVAEYCYIYIGDEYLDVDEMYRDTIGVVMSDYLYTSPVNPRDYCFVNEEMPRALSELTGLPAFK